MAIINWATTKYEGLGKDGKGHVSTQSGALKDQPYGVNTRFEDQAVKVRRYLRHYLV
ncbi:hypothetical protein [Rheinheimera gaetbuli]